MVSTVPEPKKLMFIEGGDHFFVGHMPEMSSAIQGWIRVQLANFTA